MELTKIEKELNRFINDLENNLGEISLERDKQLIETLMYVTSISQDSELKKLLELIKTNFKEYGN